MVDDHLPGGANDMVDKLSCWWCKFLIVDDHHQNDDDHLQDDCYDHLHGDACHQDGDGVDQWDHQDQDHDDDEDD